MARARRDRNPMGRVRRVHFVGVGGAGMSGIAEVMHNLGYEVSGSDAHDSAVTRHLRKLGLRVYIGHAASQVDGADVGVASTAVPADSPELRAARAARIPVIPRADMLAEIMRFRHGIAVAGTHGKTTTTSLTASLLAEGDLDPTFVIGGRLNSAGAHARLGAGRYIVVEADESDASFLRLNPVMAIVTNVDADHLDTYAGDPERLRQAFTDFVQRLPFYGLAVLCRDDPGIERMLPTLSKPYRTYGEHADADVRVRNIRQLGATTEFEVAAGRDAEWLPMQVNMPGRHQALNATAALTIARELGVSDAAIRKGLAEFSGVGRRFQIFPQVVIESAPVLLIDDYGHHPTEIAVTLDAARGGWPGRRVVLAFQPHRYTRTRDLFEDFAAVLARPDVLLLLDVYAAGEEPIAGADGRSLARAVRLRGGAEPIFAATPADLLALLPSVVRADDVLLIVGAGSIGTVAAQLTARPRRARPRPPERKSA